VTVFDCYSILLITVFHLILTILYLVTFPSKCLLNPLGSTTGTSGDSLKDFFVLMLFIATGVI